MKSNGTYCAPFVTRGFQQQEGLHYNIVAISSPVTSDTSICIVLTIMTIAGYKARVINVKAVLLKEELKNNDKIYINSQKVSRNSIPNKTHGYK